MTQQANSRSESPWDRSSDSKDLNSLITDNASQFFSSPPLLTSIHGRLSIGTAGYLTVPKSGENSPVVRYKRNTQNVSISTSNLLNDDQDSHLKSAASVPDFSSCSPNNSSYVEEFDPLVPQRADSLEELFKAFNQIAEEKLPPELPPRIKKSPSKSQPGPPLPPKPPNDVIERAFSTLEPPYLSVRPSSSDSLRSSLAPPLPRRKANSEVCQPTDENLASPDVGVVCLQPIEKLRSCIDKVKFRTESYAFSQSNCVADGFVLSTGGNNLTSNKLESLIKVRFFINDDERSSKEPYLEYRNCKLKRTANDILEFWKSNFSDLGPGHYYVRFCGCQIYMQPDSVIGSHLIVRKLFALRRPLDVCIKKVDDDIRSGKAEKRRRRSETSDLYASEAVTWPLASHLQHLVQIIVEANLEVEGDQEVGRKNSVSNRNLMRFIQSAKLLSSFLNIHYSPLSDAYDLLENSSSTDYNKKRELVMSEALDFGKYLISSFQYLKYCKEVTKLPLTAASNSQNFGVKIFSISNIGSLAVREALTKIFIDVCMYYNGRIIFKSSFRDFWHNVRSKATIEINQTLTFSDPLDCGVVRICDLPRELVLSVSLCYISETTLAEVKLASVAYPVFDCNGIFNDAQVFLPFWVKPNLPHPDYTHLSSPTLNTASNTSPILHMEIVNPSKESLVFSITQVENGADHTLKRTIPESPLRSSRLKRIDRIFQYKHENMLLRNPEIPLPNDERGDMIRDDCELIWQYRRNLLTDESYGSNYLPDVLFSNIWSWNYAQTRHINELISLCCGQMDSFSAFVILLYRFSDSALRQFAVENLDFTNDELIVLIPVLCECLKYEIYIANPLIEFLLQKCAESLLFGISLFRNFILCTSLPQYKQMFEVYKASISDICPSSVVQGFEAQERLARELEKFYTELNVEKETIVLKAFLADLNESLFQNEQQEIVSFFPPGRTCRGFNVERCFLHAKSNAKPMHLYFITKSDFELEVIYKYGDDLRQDQLMSLLMTFMNSWWLSDNLDLKFISYGVFPCTPNSGFIEVVPNAVTLCQLQTFAGGFTGALNLNCIYQWLRQKNPDATAFDIALDNFTLSTAAYCVATYILGVCDRHNDNVMILPSGHLFHIDYGRIFGHNQKFGPVNRDRTPFILTKDMFYAINRSNSDVSESYYEFVKTCCAAYNVVRRNADFVIAIVRHMIGGERPEISREIQFLVQRLQPQLSEDEATQVSCPTLSLQFSSISGLRISRAIPPAMTI